MASFHRHARSFVARTFWLSSLMGGLRISAKYLIKARGNAFAEGQAVYKGNSFVFRNCDATAIKEVLIDNEYGFLDPILREIEVPTILDVGGHIGTFSLWAYSGNKNVKVHTIEADPNTYALLKKNIEANIPAANQFCYNRAAWSDVSIIKFDDLGDSMGHKVSNKGTLEVKGIPLSEIISQTGDIDIMKVDIEGAEEEFLCKNPELLERVKHLVIELHPKLCNTDRVRGVLKKYFPKIQELHGRIDSKPVLFMSK
jgi:FkbM family methyltransferase